MKKFLLILIHFCLAIAPLFASEVFHLIKNNQAANIYYGGGNPVIETALELLGVDGQHVARSTFKRIAHPDPGAIIVGQLNDPVIGKLIKDHHISLSDMADKWEAFYLKVIQIEKVPTLLIVGADTKGTAYGVMEISRKLGVSPWCWWADVLPRKNLIFLCQLIFKTNNSRKCNSEVYF